MRLLLDENVARAVTTSLVGLGVDAVHVLDVGLGGLGDAEILKWAARESRVVVTRDYRDFAMLARLWQRAGRPMAGVLFLSPTLRQNDVGGIAEAIERRIRQRRGLEGGMSWVSGV